MELTILAASGATGLELTRQALARGHTVTAVARRPGRIELEDSARLRRVAADVHDPASIARAVRHAPVVLSGLGAKAGDPPGTLVAGARAVLDAGPGRVLWLGAFGTGPSAGAAGAFTRTLLRLALRQEIPDKVAADAAVLAAGGTVFHAGPLSTGPLSAGRRTVGLDDVPKRLFPARISRATVAAAMLDEAESPRFAASTAVPLGS
ncbi:NAD(P)H-binding protein [Amycolatopsis sp. PS_44_ISF1]|uniref:NAD(P)-dependent oxidoreductase n=1 Tax=Amycolatopsis sp. PS_44_ISF1 TaxID=2974917 RepID=UPI0028E05F94|nr:NAD(P)H-binding protein [Amycolatopsis sp. PS_44_ISF1]MDT8913390.1 NAD(P)H-binding protein [Amycolatopsis sp. PS_44_ISF1]